jgi:hypothetical protein
VLVETAVGLLFVALAAMQVLSGGANLPITTAGLPTDLFALNWGRAGQLAAMSLLHAGLLTTQLTALLIQFDRQAVPVSLWRTSLLIGLLFPAIWPGLRPVPAMIPRADAAPDSIPRSALPRDMRPAAQRRTVADGWWSGLADGAAGSCTGALVGQVLSLAVARRRRFPRARPALIASLALVGAYLGWQAAISVAAMSALMLMLVAILGRAWPAASAIPPLVWPLWASLIQIAWWKRLTEFSSGPFLSFSGVGAWLLVILAMSAVARIFRTPTIGYTNSLSKFPVPARPIGSL